MINDHQRSDLVAISDRIVEAIRALKAIELRKRRSTPSTPEYHALIEDSEDKSREIYAAAADQDRVARLLDQAGRRSTRPPNATRNGLGPESGPGL